MEGLVPRFEIDTPRVYSEAPIGLIKKTSTSDSACSCPRKQMGIKPDSYVQITHIGAHSEQGLDTLVVNSGVVVVPNPAHRLKRLVLANTEACIIQVRVDGSTIFSCEEWDCGAVASVDRYPSKGSLVVLVTQGQPTIQLERFSRREVTVDRDTPWWDQAEAERLLQLVLVWFSGMFLSSMTWLLEPSDPICATIGPDLWNHWNRLRDLLNGGSWGRRAKTRPSAGRPGMPVTIAPNHAHYAKPSGFARV